jgi:hypothetical protein
MGEPDPTPKIGRKGGEDSVACQVSQSHYNSTTDETDIIVMQEHCWQACRGRTTQHVGVLPESQCLQSNRFFKAYLNSAPEKL